MRQTIAMKQVALMRRGDGWERPAPGAERISASRRDVAFESGGITCRAWAYAPDARFKRPAPCIVMAHGLGGTRDCALEPYAQAFAKAGFFVLLFDYRRLGASDGAPRQLISIPDELEDWAAAIAFARAMPGVDSNRIGLWGTSLSGGHVMVAAARDPGVAAVAAQCPMLDGAASARMLRKDTGLGKLAWIGWAALVDRARALLGMSPYYVPLVAPPGGLAAMASHDAYKGMSAIVPPGWRNEVAARLFLVLPCYRPIRAAKSVTCPTLIIACKKDSVVSTQAATATAARMGDKARLVELPIGHFDIYLGDWFERSSTVQIAFFEEALCS
jgi:pimeloyl-ACP methyl ester carboxylesterase